ncbi:MAG: hypothetical protein A3K03_12630 [Bdellovibrionales bacterium RIFOXYD1_FULL_44_7]|nr:MAG: hypothetical protein A3K03_12630 [Bdellovibrionales bacterium RIFOXYD1_FULL_44_7]
MRITIVVLVLTSFCLQGCASSPKRAPASFGQAQVDDDCIARFDLKLSNGSLKQVCLKAEVEEEQFTSEGREIRNIVLREPLLVISGRFLDKEYFLDREGELPIIICTQLYRLPYISEGLIQYKKTKTPISLQMKDGILAEHIPDTSLNRFEYVYYYKTLVCSTERY